MHEHHEVLEARYANLADENVKQLANRPATVRCRYERDHKALSVKGEACKLGGTVWGGTYPPAKVERGVVAGGSDTTPTQWNAIMKTKTCVWQGCHVTSSTPGSPGW